MGVEHRNQIVVAFSDVFAYLQTVAYLHMLLLFWIIAENCN